MPEEPRSDFERLLAGAEESRASLVRRSTEPLLKDLAEQAAAKKQAATEREAAAIARAEAAERAAAESARKTLWWTRIAAVSTAVAAVATIVALAVAL